MYWSQDFYSGFIVCLFLPKEVVVQIYTWLSVTYTLGAGEFYREHLVASI